MRNYIRRVPGRMRRLADLFLKIEENLEALKAWERREKKRPSRRAKIRPARREVLE